MERGDAEIAGMVVSFGPKTTSGFFEILCQLHARGSTNPHAASLLSYKKSEPLSSAAKRRPHESRLLCFRDHDGSGLY
jgi:hypothetical protein